MDVHARAKRVVQLLLSRSLDNFLYRKIGLHGIFAVQKGGRDPHLVRHLQFSFDHEFHWGFLLNRT
jgi:hypothetical protein